MSLLIGFNLALRSMVAYDMGGLEWSDDSLFFYVILAQSVGAFIGIPVAGNKKETFPITVSD